MNNYLNTREIYSQDLIDFFDARLKMWTQDESIYYVGSHIFDIEGKEYRKQKDKPYYDHWAGDKDDFKDDKEKAEKIANKKDYQAIFEAFNVGLAFTDNPKSITQCIQGGYLSIGVKVLHLCVNDKEEETCEALTEEYRNIIEETAKYEHKSLGKYPPLSELGEQFRGRIDSLFDSHYQQIKKANGAHIYFIPTFLELIDSVRIINVITVITPAGLSDSDLGFVQYGIDSSTSGLLAATAKYLHGIAKAEAIKSAKAAIMSRNMSHNLGSHVMSYLKQHLSSVTTMMRDNVLREIISQSAGNRPSWNSAISKGHVNENFALPFLVGVGHFISYLQERQDFIATVATDYIPYNSTINVKDIIYDEMNPDKRYERHSERSNLRIDNILLGNIARSEGLGRSTSPTVANGNKLCDIVLKFGDFDGNLGSSEDDLERLRRFDVSLPGGIVGRQAFFSIMENAIRNSAKHGSWKQSGKLELRIDYYSKDTISNAPDDDQIEGGKSLREVLTNYYANSKDGKDVYYVTITDNSETTVEQLIKLRKALCDSYLNNANKGLKEMRISAAWLRSAKSEAAFFDPFSPYLNDPSALSKDNFESIGPDLKAPVIYARLHRPAEFDFFRLQYIICLPIPREVALITSEISTSDWKEQMESINWRVYTENENLSEFVSQETNKSFDFILCDTEDTFKRVRPFTSEKTICLSEVPDTSLDQFKEPAKNKIKIIGNLYRHLVKGHQCETIVVDDATVFNEMRELYEQGKCEMIDLHIKDQKEAVEDVYLLDKASISHKEELVEVKQPYNVSIFKGFPGGIYYKLGHIIVGNAGQPVYTQYSYRSHHDSDERFKAFMNRLRDNKISFVESITGNNSTDRLVRHEPMTEKWFYKHAHAMDKCVCVMDERIFYKLYGIDEVSFIRGKAYVSHAGFLSDSDAKEKDLNEAKEYYSSILPRDAGDRIKWAENLDVLQKIIASDYPGSIRVDNVFSKGLTGFTYYQKGIVCYTFIPAVEPNKFDIIGVRLNNDASISSNESFECECEVIAKIEWDKNKSELLVSPNVYGGKKFDFISIHQGLLDKLYDSFGIKENEKAKNAIFAGLYSYFSSHDQSEVIQIQENSSFYPGIFIHSGRSKPSSDVMSQRVPFIQYATLEHSVLDCKYTLVDLLENARYE